MKVPGYTASDWGNRYHLLPHDEALGAGAAGPGKSTCLLMDANSQIFIEHERCKNKDHPYYHPWGSSTGWALHLRRTTKMLEQSIMFTQRVFPLLDPQVKWDTQKLTWTFASGYHYQFGHCKDPDDWLNYFSSAYTHIGFDELVQFEQEQYEQIKSRVRSDDPILMKMLKVRAMSNPLMTFGKADNVAVTDPHWVRKYFVDPARHGNTTLVKEVLMDDGTKERITRIYLPATLHDNPNKQFAREYERKLQGLKAHQKAALLRGDWYAIAGSYYGEDWNPSLHTCEPFAIPPDWPVFRAMDWGNKAPGCVLWAAMDESGTVYVIREFTFQGKTDAWVAEQIRDIEIQMRLWRGRERGRSLITGPADYQIWEDRGEANVKSKAQTMSELGVNWVRADKRSRRANAERLLNRLREHQSGTLMPGIVFFRTCGNSIRSIPVIPTDRNGVDPMDGGDDHWHDAVLYLCAYASYGRKGVGRARRTNEREDDDDDPRPTERRGQYGYGSF